MRKFKLIKKIINTGINWIFDETWKYLWDEWDFRTDWRINKTIRWIIDDYLNWNMSDMYFFEYFEEIKQKVFDAPEFKIWDYVVVIPTKDSVTANPIQFMKIADIEIKHKWINNFEYNYNWFRWNKLRKPTEDELHFYFR